ncbi:hypothetical protein JW859_04870 [bacterium]|nr:hypothetical protein [bacterium]
MMRNKIAALLILTGLVLAMPALAQVTEPTRVENDTFHFAFTVEAGSLVMFEMDGPGFESTHNPQGGGKGTQPDYKLTVLGDYVAVLNEAQAEAAKLEHPEGEGVVLYVEDVSNNTRYNEIMKDAMSAADREPEGEAVIAVENGASIKVPYFIWSKTVATRTNYGLMYSVIHGDAFVAVQVVSNRPFTKQQISWFISKLELLEIPPEELAAESTETASEPEPVTRP